MQFEKHTLVEGRPDHQHTIRHLKRHDAHFVEVFNNYHQLESEVHNIEKRNAPMKDVYIESLKNRRANLKSELFEIIQKTERKLLSKIFKRSISSLYVSEA